jgi:hypothetical protein
MIDEVNTPFALRIKKRSMIEAVEYSVNIAAARHIIIIQFNVYLLTCRRNSTSANYKTSTNAQIKYKTVQIHKTKH